MSVSVVIPVYNGENSLELLFHRLQKVLGNIRAPWEIIFVNDASPDRSWEKIQKIVLSNSNVFGIKLVRNFGQHNALLAGIRLARYDVIVTIDDDLQNPPEEIPKLIFKLNDGFELVYGVPHKKQHSLVRNIASTAVRLALSSVMGAKSARHVTSFRCFRKTIVPCFENYHDEFVSIDALLSWGTNRVGETTVLHVERTNGKSNYSIKKLITHSLTMLTSYSALPLRVASLTGFVCTIFGLGVLVYVFARYFAEGGSVPGFPFLASIIALFSGAQLFSLGIIGEYLGRIHFRSMGKPSYVIEDIIKPGSPSLTNLKTIL